jgi:uncharacterized protein (DUF1501 family)
MKRRTFITTTTAAAVGAQLIGSIPLKGFSPMELMPTLQDEGDNILIVIQMFGGNDGLNTIIPVENDRYYTLRPDIGVPKEKAANVLGRVYMHPALDTPNAQYNVKRMLEDGRLAVVQGVGYENPNLSHFRSTDIWLSGINSSDPNVRLLDGWLGRYFAESTTGFPEVLPPHPLAVQIGGSLSMLLQSPKGDTGIALTDPAKFFELGQGLSPDMDPMPEDSYYAKEFNYVRMVAEQSDRYSSVIKEAYDKGRNAVTYDDKNGFVRQLQLVARLISGGLKAKVYLVFMGGFDTHVQQQNDDLSGLHPFLLESLSKGIGTFYLDALQQGFADRTVGLTVSEFGRRPAENGSRGTDHGASSVQFVFGNRVRSGVFGNDPNLEDLDGNDDLRYQYDFRRVYADVLETWFGATPEMTEQIFGERILPLGVLQSPVSVGEEPQRTINGFTVKAAPNPSTSTMTLSWELKEDSQVTIDLYSSEGRFVERVHAARMNAGPVSVPVSAQASGAYECVVRVNGRRSIVPVRFIH